MAVGFATCLQPQQLPRVPVLCDECAEHAGYACAGRGVYALPCTGTAGGLHDEGYGALHGIESQQQDVSVVESGGSSFT